VGRSEGETIDQGLAGELFALAYRVGYRMLGSRADAEDVAQETVARACARWTRVRDHPHAWAARVSANMAIDVIRRRRREHGGVSASRSQPSASAAADAFVAERAELVAALERLPRRQRDVVVLRYLADLGEAEVAQQLGCSVGSVKQHASRGLRSLRASLGAAGSLEAL
jgi:RNA polymerase sigma-70 factor (sigma-E family)